MYDYVQWFAATNLQYVLCMLHKTLTHQVTILCENQCNFVYDTTEKYFKLNYYIKVEFYYGRSF